MEESLRQQILTAFPQKTVDIRTYSPMALAFLGDAVYSLMIRTIVVSRGNRQAEKLHRETSSLVRASAQAAIGDAIWDMLTPEEQTIYKRGKNSNPSHHTRNASFQDYLKATALECLIGYLYLQDKNERILELLAFGIRTMEENGKPSKARS